ncbi:MAG: ECF transporter S component [Clostridia bacterium]|nr:ECF transporter S component [Clostridia bacterium]
MKTTTQKTVLASMLAALCCVATMLIKIPSPLKGYFNIGDSIVLLSGWLLSPFYGFFSAAIGSALADVFSGYALYAPVTFAVKGFMAVLAFLTFKALNKKTNRVVSRITSGLLSEILMVSGYYIFEGFLYGFTPSLVNIPVNALQGAVSLVIAVFLIKVFEKTNYFDI